VDKVREQRKLEATLREMLEYGDEFPASGARFVGQMQNAGLPVQQSNTNQQISFRNR
jgi:hypothetical protein